MNRALLVLALTALAGDPRTLQSMRTSSRAAAATRDSPNAIAFATPPDSGRGCCSWHGGVCGCLGGRAKCCDGTLSPSCGCNH
jgi:hypothetical protein